MERNSRKSKKRKVRAVETIGEMLDRVQAYVNIRQQTSSKNKACAQVGFSKGTINGYMEKMKVAQAHGLDLYQYRSTKYRHFKQVLALHGRAPTEPITNFPVSPSTSPRATAETPPLKRQRSENGVDSGSDEATRDAVEAMQSMKHVSGSLNRIKEEDDDEYSKKDEDSDDDYNDKAGGAAGKGGKPKKRDDSFELQLLATASQSTPISSIFATSSATSTTTLPATTTKPATPKHRTPVSSPSNANAAGSSPASYHSTLLPQLPTSSSLISNSLLPSLTQLQNLQTLNTLDQLWLSQYLSSLPSLGLPQAPTSPWSGLLPSMTTPSFASGLNSFSPMLPLTPVNSELKRVNSESVDDLNHLSATTTAVKMEHPDVKQTITSPYLTVPSIQTPASMTGEFKSTSPSISSPSSVVSSPHVSPTNGMSPLQPLQPLQRLNSQSRPERKSEPDGSKSKFELVLPSLRSRQENLRTGVLSPSSATSTVSLSSLTNSPLTSSTLSAIDQSSSSSISAATTGTSPQLPNNSLPTLASLAQLTSEHALTSGAPTSPSNYFNQLALLDTPSSAADSLAALANSQWNPLSPVSASDPLALYSSGLQIPAGLRLPISPLPAIISLRVRMLLQSLNASRAMQSQQVQTQPSFSHLQVPASVQSQPQ